MVRKEGFVTRDAMRQLGEVQQVQASNSLCELKTNNVLSTHSLACNNVSRLETLLS